MKKILIRDHDTGKTYWIDWHEDYMPAMSNVKVRKKKRKTEEEEKEERKN